jgi:hypothetical protein
MGQAAHGVRRRGPLTPKELDRIRVLREQGLTWKVIGRRMGFTGGGLADAIRRLAPELLKKRNEQ